MNFELERKVREVENALEDGVVRHEEGCRRWKVDISFEVWIQLAVMLVICTERILDAVTATPRKDAILRFRGTRSPWARKRIVRNLYDQGRHCIEFGGLWFSNNGSWSLTSIEVL